MDKLVEFLSEKIEYIISIILFGGLVGIAVIFVWSNDLFISIDVFKLILLAFSISGVFGIPNLCLGCCMSYLFADIRNGEIKTKEIFVATIIINTFLLLIAIVCKLIYPEVTIQEAIARYIIGIFGVSVIGMFISLMNYFSKKMKNKKGALDKDEGEKQEKKDKYEKGNNDRANNLLNKKWTDILKISGSIIGVVVLPFILEKTIIYGPYRKDSFDNSTWFSFLGSYVGAIVTLGVMYITFKKSSRDTRKSIKLQQSIAETNREIDILQSMIKVVLFENYIYGNIDTACENFERYMSDLARVRLQIKRLKFEGNEIAKELVEEMEAIMILEFLEIDTLQKSATHVVNSETSMEFKKMLVAHLCEVYKRANHNKNRIEELYSNYVKNAIDKVYNMYEE